MVRKDDQGHHCQRHHQAATKHAVVSMPALREITWRVASTKEEDHTDQDEEDPSQRVEIEPVAKSSDSRLLEGSDREYEVDETAERQGPGPPAVRWHGERHDRPGEGKTHQRLCHASLLQSGEVVARRGRKLAVDMVDDDPHDEHAHEQVEEHANLDDQGHRIHQQQPEDEYSVLQYQVA